MSYKAWREKLRHLERAFHPRNAGRPKTYEELAFLAKEQMIQTITGCLLDASIFEFDLQAIVHEADLLFSQVIDGKASLDVDWLEKRKPYPTTRELSNTTTDTRVRGLRARARPRVEAADKSQEEIVNEEEDQEIEQ